MRASNSGSPFQGNASGSRSSTGQALSTDRIGQSIGMRYSKENMKFTGAEDQAFHEYVSFYLQVTRDFSLTNDQKLQFMYNIFGGEAKRYFDSHVEGHVATFSEAVLIMNKQYNSATRQTAVQNRLSNLRFGRLTAQGLTEKAALETIYKTITKLAPQLPMNYRDDSHKRDYLRLSVVGVPWARDPLGRLTTESMSLERLYAELSSELQLYEEFDAASEPNPNGVAATQAVVKPNFYAGQGVYGGPNKGVGASRPGSWKGKGPAPNDGRGTRFDPLSIAGCFNCDDPKHLLKNCPKPIDAIRATQRKVAYYDKKTKGGRASVAAVLYQLTLQINPTATVEDANHLEDLLVFGESKGQPATVEEADEHYLINDNDDDSDDPAQGSSSTKQVGFAQGI